MPRLTKGRFAILTALKAGSLRLGDLAAALGMPRGYSRGEYQRAYHLLSGLVTQGYIQRESRPRHNEAEYSLAASGATLLAEFEARNRARAARVLDPARTPPAAPPPPATAAVPAGAGAGVPEVLPGFITCPNCSERVDRKAAGRDRREFGKVLCPSCRTRLDDLLPDA